MTQQRQQQRASILAVLLMVVWVWSCTTPPPADDFERDMRSAEELTVPPGVGSVEHPTPAAQNTMKVQRTWTFTTALARDDYQRWVVEQLRDRGQFNLTATTDTALAFTKSRSGDFYQLHIESSSSGPPLHVRVTFTAMPD